MIPASELRTASLGRLAVIFHVRVIAFTPRRHHRPADCRFPSKECSMRLSVRILPFIALLLLPLAAAAARPDFTVMSYNTMQLPVQDWDQANRRERLPAAIRALPSLPDVIVFEEIFTDAAYSKLASLKDVYPYRTPNVGQVCSGGGWTSISGDCSNAFTVIRGGVVVLSRWPIVEQHALVYRNSRPGTWDYQSNKGAAYVRVRKQGYDYHVAGTHMQASDTEITGSSGDDRADHAVRMAQLGEMRNWLDGFRIPAADPVMITGDLNVEYSKGDDVIAMLDASNTDLEYPANDGYFSFSAKTNWLTRANAYYSDFDLDYDDTLDYVLWRNDHLQPVEPAVQKVVKLKAGDNWYWYYLRGWWNLSTGPYYHNGYYSDLSDHYPVVATFRYGQ